MPKTATSSQVKACTVEIQYASPALEKKVSALASSTLIKKWVRASINRPGNLTVRFVNRTEGQLLNSQFRTKAYATNVLTFTYGINQRELAADIVLCMPVVTSEARDQGKAVKAHLAHLVVHGCLHAAGLDHMTQQGAKVMEAREVAILKNLGFSDPYVIN
ncbi:rRNA maturation RNase YbeY [Polynucleobacter sp.]|uniref:rRNA maturation RNase YbeY n=1 Tax=Polynucleobacter sp. TaxID=2029855 RepID=UPI0027325CFB|nr:rRNA maturation RNase YbeY [Polynucleobacter sp.]MDP3121774.1 rRNA maturation RNase YbeY [Polynucleobacter sp.]